jgi:Domain of unknown function (DUF3825)
MSRLGNEDFDDFISLPNDAIVTLQAMIEPEEMFGSDASSFKRLRTYAEMYFRALAEQNEIVALVRLLKPSGSLEDLLSPCTFPAETKLEQMTLMCLVWHSGLWNKQGDGIFGVAVKQSDGAFTWAGWNSIREDLHRLKPTGIAFPPTVSPSVEPYPDDVLRPQPANFLFHDGILPQQTQFDPRITFNPQFAVQLADLRGRPEWEELPGLLKRVPTEFRGLDESILLMRVQIGAERFKEMSPSTAALPCLFRSNSSTAQASVGLLIPICLHESRNSRWEAHCALTLEFDRLQRRYLGRTLVSLETARQNARLLN